MNSIFRNLLFIFLICFGLVLSACMGLVDAPDSSIYYQIENLGYIEAHDDVIDKTYAFRVYKETNTASGEVMIKIKSNLLAGTSITPQIANKKSLEAEEKGMKYSKIGSPFNSPGKNDPRKIEYRLYQKNGKPDYIKIFVVTRKDLHKRKAPKILKVDWLY